MQIIRYILVVLLLFCSINAQAEFKVVDNMLMYCSYSAYDTETINGKEQCKINNEIIIPVQNDFYTDNSKILSLERDLTNGVYKLVTSDCEWEFYIDGFSYTCDYKIPSIRFILISEKTEILYEADKDLKCKH